jgi:serine/threonine-protein kinase
VDVYAFGVLLYELVSGTRPFEAPTVDGIFDLILHQPVDLELLTRSATPAWLQELIRELTAKDPSERPQHMSAVLCRMTTR